MWKAVQFGAGNIGRGFLGQLYFESGFETAFVDVDSVVVDTLNARKGYAIQILDDEPSVVNVSNVRAIAASDAPSVAGAVAEADIVATSVGVAHVGDVAPGFAAGLALRLADPEAKPLNLILCENMLNAAAFMREKVAALLDPALLPVFTEKVGFVEASIGRMVPVVSAETRAEDPLWVGVEAYCDLPVDAEGFKGPIPQIKHLLPKPNFAAYVERKLFVHNAGHASAAFLGYLKHLDYVWEAMQEQRIRAVVDGAMAESCEGLHRKHGLPLDELQAHAEDLKRRFQNKALGDQIVRVAGDPLRKLGPDDRLIGAIKMCDSQGVVPENLAMATAGAMMYDNPDDRGALQLHAMWRDPGPEGILETVCGLPVGSPLARLVLKQATKVGILARW